MLKLAQPTGPFLLRTAGLDGITVPTIADASSVSRNLISESGVGSSEWSGAEVRLEETGELIAVLSYNGRAFNPGRANDLGRVLPGELEFDLTNTGAI